MRPKGVQAREVRLFIHGAAGYASYLSCQMRYAAERGVIAIAPELPHHGERHSGGTSKLGILDYVRDVHDFISTVVNIRYSPNILTLIGHSMGGLIALKLAESGLGDRLVLITPAPPKGVRYLPGRVIVPSLEDITGVFRLLIFREPFKPSRKLISSFFADPIASAPMIESWIEGRVAGESLVALSELAFSSIEVDTLLVRIPTLVIVAEKDVIIHKNTGQGIAKYLNADLRMLPDLGHMCVFEHGWEKTSECMGGWLKKKS